MSTKYVKYVEKAVEEEKVEEEDEEKEEEETGA